MSGLLKEYYLFTSLSAKGQNDEVYDATEVDPGPESLKPKAKGHIQI